mmetsp:Transcript_11295/g.28334  ORF Transcript_11295/g.28334 Transcript_11295/m.28334 type:complete len:130 (+) Transcript_11295:59-448(+)|eukprot:CAMPEP_0115242074 /NCGR_PEP_ID=MMETSP0270-20121206/38761_1 /TAXON_ID=71861 /ORGANISM="Scrippsiella trochoidea, Strain CCMP3099" /LENGTH=129 /DNA_ID=CAMNT_0002657121 /DNA_START=64 /DNA_END=453 /DNA_ORIENTATION=-
MARRARSSVLSTFFVAAAMCLATQWALLPSGSAFVQPRGQKAADVAPAVGALAALTASLPAEAYSFKGPLTGSEVCTQKPLFYIIAPACDPIFLVSPIYLAPILIVFWGTIITVIQLLIPATQPDEDLR